MAEEKKTWICTGCGNEKSSEEAMRECATADLARRIEQQANEK